MKRKGIVKILIGIVCIALFTGVFAEESFAWPKEKKVLNVGLIPAEDPEKVLKSFRPLMGHLEKTIGMKIEPFVATSYAGVIEAMRVGKIDVAWFGPFSYIQAAERANATAIAKGVDRHGNTTYNSVLITHKASGIKDLNDLKGKTVAFVDPVSTSGHLIPRSMLIEAGINPEKDLKNIIFAGGHDAVGLAVKHRHVDAGGLAEIRVKSMIEKGIASKDEIIILATSDPIPNSPIAVRKDMDPKLKKQIKQAILGMHKHVAEGTLMGWDRVIRYVEARDEQYDGLREIARALGKM